MMRVTGIGTRLLGRPLPTSSCKVTRNFSVSLTWKQYMWTAQLRQDSSCTFANVEMLHLHLKGKEVPFQAWSGPEGSRKLRYPDFMTTAQDGGKVVSPTHRPPLPPRKYTWYSFLLEAESTPGP
jgi:hypothetical protein